MRTAPRSYADADTTRSPPTPAGYDGAPAHGPGHAREQRLPRPQARLVLPGLQPALLPAARRPRGLCPPGNARALRAGLCPAHAGAVGDGPQPGSRRGPDPGRAARLLDQAPCPAYPELSALLRGDAAGARHAALQAAPPRAGAAGAAPGQGGTPCCASLGIPTAVSGLSMRMASCYVSPSTKKALSRSCDACNRCGGEPEEQEMPMTYRGLDPGARLVAAACFRAMRRRLAALSGFRREVAVRTCARLRRETRVQLQAM